MEESCICMESKKHYTHNTPQPSPNKKKYGNDNFQHVCGVASPSMDSNLPMAFVVAYVRHMCYLILLHFFVRLERLASGATTVGAQNPLSRGHVHIALTSVSLYTLLPHEPRFTSTFRCILAKQFLNVRPADLPENDLQELSPQDVSFDFVSNAKGFSGFTSGPMNANHNKQHKHQQLIAYKQNDSKHVFVTTIANPHDSMKQQF